MIDMIELIEDHTRLTVEADTDPLNPRTDMESPVGCYRAVSMYRPFDGPPSDYKFPGDLDRAHERLWDYYRPLDPEHNVTRWAAVAHDTALIYDLGSYWWCDRQAWNLLVGREWNKENQIEVIRQEIQTWRRYTQGEAVIVSLERRATFKRVTPSRVNENDLLHVWERVDSIGDIYLDDYNESLIRVAADHFGHEFNNKERAVIQAAFDEERVLSGKAEQE